MVMLLVLHVCGFQLVSTTLNPTLLSIASTNLFMKTLFFKLATRLNLETLLHLLINALEVLILFLKLESEK